MSNNDIGHQRIEKRCFVDKRAILGVIVLCWLCLTGVSCGGDETPAGETPAPTLENSPPTAIPDNLSPAMALLVAAEQKWQSQKLQNYVATIVHTPNGVQGSQTHIITFETGIMVNRDDSCYPPRDCVIRPVTDDQLTIPGLFGLVRQTIETAEQGSIEITELMFDDEYGHLTVLYYAPPNSTSGTFWAIQGFEVNEP